MRTMVTEAGQQKLGTQHSPLTSLIVKEVRDRIVSGSLPAGQRLVEAKLSEELGVSRMPVREALRVLAAEGLVRIEPRMGASVTQYTAEQAREMVEVRATLEALNARLAARRKDPLQLAELERILAQGMSLWESGDSAVLAEKNRQFHDVLGNVAANSVLTDMMRSLRERTSLIFAPYNLQPERARQNWEEHAAILRAVIAGDGPLAALLAERHVYNAARMTQDN